MTNQVSRALVLGFAAFTLCTTTAPVAAQTLPEAGAPAAPSSAMSVGERRALIDALVTRWGPFIQANYGADVEIWRERLTLWFLKADPTNLRDAVKQESYDGAMATLVGRGMQVTDGAVAARGEDGAIGAKFGDLTQDLVYTPVAPCRIVDTRSTGAGAIAAGGTRSFVAVNASSFSGQGGSATNCGTLGLSATAVAINVTAVTPGGPGYTTVYPFGTTMPLASSINYTQSAIVNNTVIAQIPNPLSSFDFTIFSSAQSHYVADIVGYFAPPLATALQCVDTANTTVANIAADGTANATAPACATGYTQTATNCETSSWLMPIVFIHSGTCSARNNDTTPQDLRASRTCCRVPGR